jgi:hypothetical protein
MRKVWIAALGIGLLGVGWWAGAHHSTASADLRATPPAGGVDEQHAKAGRTPLDGTGADSEDVAALRAQLRERDKLLGALALKGALAQQASDDKKASAETKAGESPTARAIAKLNQRLFGGDSRQPEARDVKTAMEVAIQALPSSVKATVDCSSELCRVGIEGAEDQLDRDSGQLAERLPKRFAGTIVLPDGSGRRVVYAATRQELLSVRDEPAEKVEASR